MLYSEIIAVCSQIHTKHINTLCGQNVELVNVRPGPWKAMVFEEAGKWGETWSEVKRLAGNRVRWRCFRNALYF
jgi:hypothetical protein